MCSLLLLVSMNALVGRRLLLLFQALSRKSSSDPVRPFVRVCIYKETSSSFASTMPPTRTHKRNKIRSFFSHRIYFTLCVCVYLLHGRDSRVKTLCFIFGFFFLIVRLHLKSWIGLREMAASNELSFYLSQDTQHF